MSEPGWAGFIAEHHTEETPAERAVRLAQQAEQRDEREAARAEAERRAAAEDERERRLFQYQQLGIGGRSLADLATDASRAAEEDDQYQQALKTIQRIDKRRAARQEATRYQAEQVAAVAQRSETSDPLEQATRRAHQAFRDATRAKLAAPAAPQRGRRPFARRSGEGDPMCPECAAAGASEEESFLLHSDPQPLKAPAVPGEDEQDWLSSHEAGAERRTQARGYGLAIR